MRLSSSCTARRDAAEPPDAHDRGEHIGAGAPSLTRRVGMRLAVELSPSRRRGGREASQWSCSEATRIVQNGLGELLSIFPLTVALQRRVPALS